MNKSGLLKKVVLFASLLLSSAAWAQVATIAELKGSAQAVPAVGAPRDLRQGDSLNQGETVSTKAMSSAVIRFEDGQIVALTQNSRLAINSYNYNKMEPAKSNMLLSLLDGGMRAVTGLIGKAKPENVTYKAANATIGIRGTDLEVGVGDGDDLYIIANEGEAEADLEVEEDGPKVGWLPMSGNMAAMLAPVDSSILPVQLAAKKRAKLKVTVGNGFVRISGKVTRGNTANLRSIISKAAKLAGVSLSAAQLDAAVTQIKAQVRADPTPNKTSVNVTLPTKGSGTGTGAGTGTGGGQNCNVTPKPSGC